MLPLGDNERLTVLTGAGISAESGIPQVMTMLSQCESKLLGIESGTLWRIPAKA